jgi:hypothetical protein
MNIAPCYKENFAMLLPKNDFFSKEKQQELIDTFPMARLEYISNSVSHFWIFY